MGIKDFHYGFIAFTLGEGKFISPRIQLFLRKAKPYAENIYLCMQLFVVCPYVKGAPDSSSIENTYL